MDETNRVIRPTFFISLNYNKFPNLTKKIEKNIENPAGNFDKLTNLNSKQRKMVRSIYNGFFLSIVSVEVLRCSVPSQIEIFFSFLETSIEIFCS